MKLKICTFFKLWKLIFTSKIVKIQHFSIIVDPVLEQKYDFLNVL